jgi:hypothetical protein
MGGQCWFRQAFDREKDVWAIYGNPDVGPYVIRSEHTIVNDGDIDVVAEYKAETYERSDDELAIMGEMHEAYRAGRKSRLETAIRRARNTFEGSARVIDLYEAAAELI